ncbi:MAG: single-stranded DNA-binding protein [Terriglobia bacterium]|nr:single-stranded DNA-binding protein [Terriglobia bacterium]
MPGFQKIRILGNIGSVEPRMSNGGSPYIRINVAVNEAKRATTDWYSCALTGKAGENKEKLKWLLPGRLVHVEGKLRSKAFTKSDGSLAVSNTILVTDLEFVDNKPKDVPD